MNLLRSFATLGLVALLLAVAAPAAAHKTAYTDDGSVKIVWGFLNEPATTYTKNGLDLRLSMNATGNAITGAEETLTASLLYGDQVHVFEDFGGRHGQPGAYTGVVTLTKPGLYSLRLQGTINGTEVDVTVPAAHEIAAIETTYFPEAPATDVASLEARIAALEQKLQTQSETPAPVTNQPTEANDVPALGLLPALAALGVVALVAARRRP